MNCPCCGRPEVKPRAVKRDYLLPERADIDAMFSAGRLTHKAYFAECKRIAPRDDLRFLLHVAGAHMPIMLRAEANAFLSDLESRASTQADTKTINGLRDRYRIARYKGVPWNSDFDRARLAGEVLEDVA